MSSNKLLENLMNQEKEQKTTPQQTAFIPTPLMELKGEGVFRFRIIANLVDSDELPFEQVFIHLGFIHPNFGKRVPLPCLGKNCPLCSYYKQKDAQGNGEAWKYQCNQRFIYFALNDDMNPVLLSLTYAQQTEIQAEMIGLLKSGVNIMDINSGRWIQFTSRIINKKRKYIAKAEDEIHSIPQEIRNKFPKMRPLKGYYKAYKDEELRKIIRGEKLQFAPNNQSKVASKPNNPDLSPEEEKKYKPLQKMVEKKEEPPKKPVYSSEVIDSLDEESENERILNNLVHDDD
jgi:hypothetical protein